MEAIIREGFKKKGGKVWSFAIPREGGGSSMVIKNHTACPYQEPPDAVTHLNDLLGMNQTQDTLDKVSSDLTLPSSVPSSNHFSKSHVLILVLSFSATGFSHRGVLQVILWGSPTPCHRRVAGRRGRAAAAKHISGRQDRLQIYCTASWNLPGNKDKEK